MRKLILSLLLILSLSLSYALQVLEPEYHPKIIHPGDDVDLWVKVYNDNYNDNYRVENLVIKITPYYPFELKQVNPTKGEVIVNELNPGEDYTAYFKLHVNENAESGDYKIKIEVSYDLVNIKTNEKYHYNYGKIFYLPIYGVADFVVNGNFSLVPAKTMVVPITIKNVGTGKAKDVNVYVCYLLNSTNIGSYQKQVSAYETTITESKNIAFPVPIPLKSSLIYPVGESKFYLSTLNPKEEKKIFVKLYTSPKAFEGSYPLPIVITWTDEDGTKKAQLMYLGAYVKGDIILDVSNVITSPREIKPGDNYVRIDVTITNNGHAEAKDVKVKLITKKPFKDSWSNCNFKGIGNLLPGMSKVVSFYIDVDKYAEAKHYKLPLEIYYLDPEDNKHEEIEYIDIYVKAKPLFKILTKEFNVTAGKDNTIYIKIKNIGNEKAVRVRISAIKTAGQPFDYPQKSDIIGTLYPNQTGVGAIVVSVDKNAIPKPYRVTLEIRCAGDSEEGDDNVYVYQEPIILNVKKGSSNILYIIGVVILIAIALFFKFVKRKNEENNG
ncbi:COG1361 S-layer family protein [Methanocaldococcus sp.]